MGLLGTHILGAGLGLIDLGVLPGTGGGASVTTIAPQTLRFGALTPANTGGAQLRDDTGALIPVTGVVSTVSGDGSGWTAAGGRLVRTTATPASSNGAVLRCTHAGGAVDVTIATDAWTYDIVETADLAVAEADMRSRKLEPGATTAAWVMRLRDGVELVELPGTNEITLWSTSGPDLLTWFEAPGVPGDEVLYWPNRHAQTDADYDYNAVGYYQGGHLTYTCETPGGAAFRGAVFTHGATNLHFKWLRFEHTAQPADGKYVNPSVTDASKPWPERESITTPRTVQFTGLSIFRFGMRYLFTACRFGGNGVLYDDGVTPVISNHWLDARSVAAPTKGFIGEILTQDCVYDGYREAGASSGDFQLTAQVRNISRQRIIDFNKSASNEPGNVQRMETVANFEYDFNDNPDFGGDHSDFHQAGSDDEFGGINHFASRNIVDTTLVRRVYLYKNDHDATPEAPAITAGTGGLVNGINISVARASQGFLAVPHRNIGPIN